MLAVVLANKYIAPNCKSSGNKRGIFVQIINLVLACMVLSCIIMNFSWANILKKLKWHKVYTSHCRVRINKMNGFQKGHLLDFFSMYILYVIYIAWWGYKPIFCLVTLFYLPDLHSSDLLRQVLKIALAKNVQMCSMSIYVHAFYYVSFLFSLRVLLKISITAIKTNHHCPIIELLSNVCWKHPSEF